MYKREAGKDWVLAENVGKKGFVPHPVKKDGRFDFEPYRYFENLSYIQKDNQNTVSISTVNKIGLSNTQRFLGGGSLPHHLKVAMYTKA